MHACRNALHGYTPARLPKFTQEFAVSWARRIRTSTSERGSVIFSYGLCNVQATSFLKIRTLVRTCSYHLWWSSYIRCMEGSFRQVGVSTTHTVKNTYTWRQRHRFCHKEATSGQVLQEGSINELGSMASWVAAATRQHKRSTDDPVLHLLLNVRFPTYWRYGLVSRRPTSLRGFLLGATAGRTRLNGEGLQHEDGHLAHSSEHDP